MQTKTCLDCKITKDLSNFGKYKQGKYYYSYCKSCKSKRTAKSRYKNKAYRIKKNRKKQLRKYGLTIEQHEQIYINQQGRCIICNTFDPVLNVDHCHKTGIVRGLLCKHCNLGLGYFRDNTESLEKAISYLKNSGTDKKKP